LQILADTSYNVETVDGAKNVLYGNHYGPRFFYRMRNRWGITPFAEALVGGSNFKTTVSGSGGYTSSTGATLSYKVGGGVDIKPSHRWEIRLIDVDYYKTAFGTDTHQTNYWISTGVVLRLFGGGSE
jgi:opacity protein-like surface antigen